MYSSLEVCQSNKYSEFFETHAKQCFNLKFQKRDSLFDWHVYSSLVKIRRKNQNKNCIFVSFCKNSQVLKIHFACDYRSLIKNKKKNGSQQIGLISTWNWDEKKKYASFEFNSDWHTYGIPTYLIEILNNKCL